MITMEVSFDALMNSLSAEKRAEIYDYMSCENAVIENVVSQITHGATAAGSWMGDSVGVDRNLYPSPIMIAKRYLIDNSKEIIAEEAKRYLVDIDNMRAEIIKLRAENMALSMQVRTQYGR